MTTTTPAPYDAYRRRTDKRLAQALADAAPETSPFAGASAEVRDAVPGLAAALQPRLDALVLDLDLDLDEHPRLRFAEHRSVRAVATLLAEHGVEAEVGVYGLPTALRAVAGSGTGPRVVILAECDALPGVGHGCGHNLIAAQAVGAFLVVRDLVAQIGGTVELIGTPAGRAVAGSSSSSMTGGFDGVDAAIMVHPGTPPRSSTPGPAFGTST